MIKFSWLTVAMLALGWLSHWLLAVRKARAAARAAGTSEPSLLDYWTADPYTTALSVVGVVVGYFVIPSMAVQWPEVGTAIGSTTDDPMNPLAAYLGGIVAPWIADIAGRRLAAMVGDP
jgi:hypothetical protein